jgi:predicted transposase/invertase (TIGR01784 family)
MQFADIKNDLAFRKIFGNENRTESLVSFLNAVLEFEDRQKIVSVKLLNPYQLPNLSRGKTIILDIRATDQLGRSYLVEMQVAETDGFDKRVLFYFSKSYSDQIERGEFYKDLKPVIFVGILDFVFTKNPHFISRNQVRDVETNERTLHDVEFNFIELPKFNKEPEELENLTDKWIYFLKNAENLDMIPEDVDDEGLKTAYQQANKHTWTKKELAEYDYLYMREADERGRYELVVKRSEKLLAEAQKEINESRQKVAEERQKAEEERQKAEEERQKAEEERQKAEEERQKAEEEKKRAEKAEKREQNRSQEVARNAIAAGLENALISQITGLTFNEIDALREELKS